MADAITSVPVGSEHLSQWNAEFYEYDYVAPVGAPTVREWGLDLETLTIRVANRRATVIEEQIEPMAVRMEQRNDELSLLSAALGDMAGFSAKFVADPENDNKVPEFVTSSLSEDGLAGLKLIGVTKTSYDRDDEGNIVAGHDLKVGNENKVPKSDVDTWTQKLQGASDTRNNEAQKDMTRIQSLVDRRDDSYKLSSTLSEKIASTRGSTIKNM